MPVGPRSISVEVKVVYRQATVREAAVGVLLVACLEEKVAAERRQVAGEVCPEVVLLVGCPEAAG